MTNREWLMNQSKEQIITNTSKPCPHHYCPDILKSCTKCWTDWLDEEHKEQIITNVSKPCPHHYCPDILKSCTKCWIDWLDEEHKEPDEPEN